MGKRKKKRHSKYIWYSLSAFVFLVLIAAQFQNCGPVSFSGTSQVLPFSIPTNPGGNPTGSTGNDAGPADCTFNGQVVHDGDPNGVTAYQTSTVPFGQDCVSEKRICTNGVLSGSFAFASCSPGVAASCLFNGITYPSDSEKISPIPAFQSSTVPYGETCVSENRFCVNGVLTGSFPYSSCSPGAPASCLFNGKTYPSDPNKENPILAYQTSTVPYGQTCVSEDRFCFNGALSGSFGFSSCTPGSPASCLLNGETIPSGSDPKYACEKPVVPAGQNCKCEWRVCDNGHLSGSFTNSSCTMAPPDAPASCQFNGQTIPDGGFAYGYAVSSVPFGQGCPIANAKCVNGSFTNVIYPTCTAGKPADCPLPWGGTLPSGQSIDGYSTASVVSPDRCQNYHDTLSCYNGTLTGGAVTLTCEDFPTGSGGDPTDGNVGPGTGGGGNGNPGNPGGPGDGGGTP